MWTVVIPHFGNARHLAFGCNLSRRNIRSFVLRVAIVCRLHCGVRLFLCHLVSAFRIAHGSTGGVSADGPVFASCAASWLWFRDKLCSSESLKSLTYLYQSLPR